MNKVIIPTGGKQFAIFIGAVPTPRPWGADRKFLERIGVRPRLASAGRIPTDGRAFAEAVRGRK